MSELIIKGGKKLYGSVDVQSAKNSVVMLIACAVLSEGKVVLKNVKPLSDVINMCRILNNMGAKCFFCGTDLVLDCSSLYSFVPDENLSQTVRCSFFLTGALLSKFKKAEMTFPGGCKIGTRPINIHLQCLKKLGVTYVLQGNKIILNGEKMRSGVVNLAYPSVGATENIILASVYADGITKISNAAMEPEIVDLAKFLNKMGAKVSGAGSNVIKVVGVKRLKEISYTIMPDRIEAGTFLVYTAMTGGKINLQNVNTEHILPVISKLEEAGCKIFKEKNEIVLNAPKRLKAIDIQTFPYPGFPTDMQSIFLSMARGTSVVTENIFENRFKCVPELIKMGAHISISGSSAIIKGTKRLIGKDVTATDLRGGAALIGAGLKAKGVTCINNCEFVERGYENLEYKLKKLDVDIIKQRGLRFETEEKKSSSE